MKPERIVEELARENEWRYMLTSLAICLFARRIYTEKRIVEALRAIGIERSIKDLEDLGRRIYQHAFEFKLREGFDFNKVKVPQRFFESPSANGKLNETVLNEMLREYVKREFGLTLQN